MKKQKIMPENKIIYFDNNATTPIAPEVFEAMKPFLTEFYGNASSAYSLAQKTKRALDTSRRQVAELLSASDETEIVFTSGGTESDNWAILGALEMNPGKKHIVTTQVEHEAVRKLCDKLARQNYEITRLEVDETGAINLDELKQSLRPDTAIVSIMLANNETGILFPIEEASQIVKENSEALFHSDGVNAVGKIPIDLKRTKVDLFSLSGHKFHAPKGVGALYIKKGTNLPPFLIGGGQEHSRRAGTEAAHQIVGLGAAAKLCQDFSAMEKVCHLRDRLETGILKKIPNTSLNGTNDQTKRLPNTANISFAGINGEMILAKLNDAGVFVSIGSACHAESHTASPVLQAMNIPYHSAMGAIRFSLGRHNTDAEVDFVLEILPKIIDDLSKLSF